MDKAGSLYYFCDVGNPSTSFLPYYTVCFMNKQYLFRFVEIIIDRIEKKCIIVSNPIRY